MKNLSKIAIAVSILGCSAYAVSASASDFEGAYVGAGVGMGSNKVSGTVSAPYKRALGAGVEAGYNWDISDDGWLLGLDAFYDKTQSKDRTDSTGTSVDFGDKTYGLDGKIGYAMGNFLPYFKIGYGQIKGTGDASFYSEKGTHFGLGAELKLSDNWSVSEEVTRLAGKNSGGVKLTNTTLLFSLKYYFGGAKPVAMAPVAAAPAYTPPPPAPAPMAPPPKPEPKVDRVTLSAQELFGFDSAKLAASQPKLDQIAQALMNNNQIENVTVTGYTDFIGSEKYNRKLSLRRAEAVKAYLVGKGVEASRIEAVGKGEADPVVDCKGKRGSTLIKCLEPNRRVEVEQFTYEKRM